MERHESTNHLHNALRITQAKLNMIIEEIEELGTVSDNNSAGPLIASCENVGYPHCIETVCFQPVTLDTIGRILAECQRLTRIKRGSKRETTW